MLWEDKLSNLELRIGDDATRYPRIGSAIQASVQNIFAPMIRRLNTRFHASKESTYHLSKSCGSISYTSPSFTRMSYGAALSHLRSQSPVEQVNRRHIRLVAKGLLTTYPKNTTGRGYDAAMMRANSMLCNSLSKGSSSGDTQ